MKNLFLYLIFTFIIVISCQKEKPSPIPDPCENAYDLRSKAYGSIYVGTIETGCPIMAGHLTPDKYFYTCPSSNPNNEFEFCYLRQNSESQSLMDLYKYDFCTEKGHPS